MESNTITIPFDEYRRLVATEARVQALMAYVNRTKYDVERELVGGMLGFHVGGSYESDGKPDGE